MLLFNQQSEKPFPRIVDGDNSTYSFSIEKEEKKAIKKERGKKE